MKNGNDAIDRPATARRSHRQGMTLMELMVSVAILSIMILAFSTILSRSQLVVSTAQQSMRANASASAIAQVMRTDLRSVTKLGFMYIKPDPANPMLIVTEAGDCQSVSGTATGLGSFVQYCVGTNSARPGEYTLCRRAYILDNTAASTGIDKWGIDLATLQSMPGSNVSSIVNDARFQCPPTDPSRTVKIPVTSLADINGLWQVLAPRISNLAFAYAIRDASGNLIWNSATTGVTWTHDNQSSWPIAVRITFTLATGSQEATALGNVPYEVVCSIGQ